MQPVHPEIATDRAALSATMFVERLSVFAKNAFVYPDNNERVQGRLAEVIGALRVCCAGVSTLVLGVVDSGLSVAGVTIPSDAQLVGWLRTALVTSRVGMVAFQPTVEPEAILAWVRHLQRAHSDRAVDYATAWAGAILPGIMVREFMLAPDAVKEVEDLHRAEADNESAVAGLKSALAQNVRIASELRALQKLLAQDTTAAADQVTDLLGELVNNMSGEAIRDPGYAAVVAERVLSSVRRTFMQEATRGRADGITPMLIDLARKLFPRIPSGPATIVAAPGRGHNDDHITDDPDALLRELAQAEAEGASIARRPAAVAIQTEQLQGDTSESDEVAGIVLHTLSTTDRLSADSLRDRLIRLALVAGPAVKTTICAYLDRALADDERGVKGGRLQVLLHSLDARGMLRNCGFLDADAVASDFPRRLGLLVDVCSVEQSAVLLADVARLVGVKAILGAERWFASNRAVLAGDRIQRLLPCGGGSLLPFAILAMRYSQNDCRVFVAEFLRGLGSTHPVTAPLLVADPNTRLPADYLALLAQFLIDGGDPPAELVRVAGRALRHAAQELAGQLDKEPRRLACFRAMRGLESDDLRDYLREVVSARRRLLFKREPSAVRQAAREILSAWRKR